MMTALWGPAHNHGTRPQASSQLLPHLDRRIHHIFDTCCRDMLKLIPISEYFIPSSLAVLSNTPACRKLSVIKHPIAVISSASHLSLTLADIQPWRCLHLGWRGTWNLHSALMLSLETANKTRRQTLPNVHYPQKSELLDAQLLLEAE